MTSLVVELSRRGKLVLGEPYFSPGTPLPLDRKTLGDGAPGDLALVSKGRGRARVQRVIGPAKEIQNVLEALLVERGARGTFEPFDRPKASEEGRVDLRDLVTFTIDPDTAKDFDDALSVRAEGSGLRAWVHIADVSHFVPAGSPLDRGAAERANSVYVPGLVAPMLPPQLSDDACSLRPREDRLAVTVEVLFDGALRPAEPRFYRSVINSDERFTYGRVQRILQAGEQHDLADDLRLTERLATELRRRRFERGALRVESREIAFTFDGGRVERAYFEEEAHAHMLVEELMIFANEAVAELLSARQREGLYRVHERPDPQAVQLLLAKLGDLGVPTPPAPEAEAMGPAEAARVAAEASERVTAYVARSGRGREAFPALVLRSLKQARYDPRNLGHSGLASVAYCHFTSPIRRYPDLVVHRALLRELGQHESEVAAEALETLAEHTSLRERHASEIEYLADEICLAWLLEDELYERGWEDPYEGEIIGVIPSGLFIRFGGVFEGYLPVRRLGGDYYEVNELGTALVGRRSGRPFRLGDKLEILVEEIRRSEGKVELRPAVGARERHRGRGRARAGRR